MKKIIFKCITFLLILLVILIILSKIFVPKNNTKEAGLENKFILASGIYLEPENTIDVLVVGDSESYTSYIPLEMWNQYGFTSYVCGTAAQPLPLTFKYIYDTLKKQNPKMIIIEANAVYRRKGLDIPIATLGNQLFPIVQYHDRWKDLALTDFTSGVNYTNRQPNKGYYYSKKTSVVKEYVEYMKRRPNKSKTVPILNKIYMEFIKKYCDAKGIELMLYSSPAPANWTENKHNGVQKLADHLGIDYIDFNTMHDKLNLNFKTDYREDDGDHPNHLGALKVTKLLGEYLHENKTLPDHRTDEKYSSWNEDYEHYKESSTNKK